MVNCLQHLAAAHAAGELSTQGVYVISILHTSLPNNGRITGGIGEVSLFAGIHE